MSTKRKVLVVVAVLFTLLNIGGAVVAGIAGEALHTVGHIAFAVVGVLAVATLAPSRRMTAERLHH